MTWTPSHPTSGSSSMFTHPSLPSNEELPFLPPLPDTPQHSYKSYHSDEYMLRARTPITRKIWEERLNGNTPSSASFTVEDTSPQENGNRSSKKWDVEVDYPILSTRQQVFGPPLSIGRTPSKDYTKVMRTPCQAKFEEKHREELSSESENVQPVIDSPINKITEVQAQSHLDLSEKRLFPNGSEDPHVHSRTLSPSNIADPTSPQHVQGQPRISASFNLPTYIADDSLLADQSLMGGSTSSTDEDSFHLELNNLRPQPANTTETGNSSQNASTHSATSSNTPTKLTSRSRAYLVPPQNALDQSTLLPRSPAKSAHLLDPINALTQVQPPWTGDESDLYESSVSSSREASLSPEKPGTIVKPSSSLPSSITTKGFPSSSSSHSIVSLPRITRTFPASSSGQSLSSVAESEDHEYPLCNTNADISTLLPVSPLKTAHLLTDSELITRETLVEEASFRLPLTSSSTRKTPYRPMFMSKTPRKSPPAKMSPIKTIVKGNINMRGYVHEEFRDIGDTTFDLKDLLAKVGKPKRASGTEESFVDLLHDDFMPDGLDASMMGPDESMLPSSYRPRNLRTASISPIKQTSIYSPSRQSRLMSVPSHTMRTTASDPSATVKRLPTSYSSRNLPTQSDEADEEVKQSTMMRSKSLSRMAEMVERVRSERSTFSHSTEHQHIKNDKEQERPKQELVLVSPPKTATVSRDYVSTRTPGTPAARPRTSTMPPPATSRRISLSAGAIPITSHASLKHLNLPPSRTTQPRSTAITTQDATLAAAGRSLTTTRPATGTAMSTSRLVTTCMTSTRQPVPSRTTARTCMAPPLPQAVKARIGPSSSTQTSSATLPTIPIAGNATTSSRLTSRPSTIAKATTTTRGATGSTSASHVVRPSLAPRPIGLPKPGDGPTARSNTTSTSTDNRAKVSRGFGNDPSTTMNRLSRPPVASTSNTKLSSGPSTLKARALSTPASLVNTASKLPPVPALPTSRLTRPSTTTTSSSTTRPITSTANIRNGKSSMPPPSTNAGTQRARTGSTTTSSVLPRPSVRTTISGKSSAPPSASAGPGTGLTALRERLDKLHARQGR
ncbi:uncharacterized protein IL334_000218 [Kwoniella shivajii]|uniref:Uncharacterized protein n=1 Tax=Kwoniella shivajii TaxID=564305 RepID=A0ABZ1CP37_9TREE|nr:hypothetical protein IL334_000218 [Kwoniella shivajii]